MKGEKVREQCPEQWVLVEAIFAYSENSIRYMDELSVISNFPESTIAWKEYKKLHLADPSREYYIFHTDHELLEVKEQKFIGVRRDSNDYYHAGCSYSFIGTFLQRK